MKVGHFCQTIPFKEPKKSICDHILTALTEMAMKIASGCEIFQKAAQENRSKCFTLKKTCFAKSENLHLNRKQAQTQSTRWMNHFCDEPPPHRTAPHRTKQH